MENTELINKLNNFAGNRAILDYLEIDEAKDYESGNNVSGFDEGGVIFFSDYADLLPGETKIIINRYCNALANPTNGEIFAFHFGRFSFAFKCDFKRAKIDDVSRMQIGYTLDDLVDISCLGQEWCLLNWFCDDEPQQLLWAYELSMKKR